MSKRDLNNNSCGQFGKLKSAKAANRFSVANASSSDQYARVRRRARKSSTEKTEKSEPEKSQREHSLCVYMCVCSQVKV